MQEKNDNHLITYQDDNDLAKVSVRFADGDVWVRQGQLAEVYVLHSRILLYNQEHLCKQRIGKRCDSQEILVSLVLGDEYFFYSCYTSISLFFYHKIATMRGESDTFCLPR